MFSHVKSLFPEAILLKQYDSMDTTTYHWFKSREEDLIGIPKSSVTPREMELLSAFMEPFYYHAPTLTTREQQWSEWILSPTTTSEVLNLPNRYRFVFFSLAERGMDPASFHEAIQGLFPTTMPILWENDHQGIIIEENVHLQEESISYDHIIDVLMSDFYMKLYLYITPFYREQNQVKQAYEFGKQCFHTMLGNKPKPVMTYQDVLPLLYITSIHEPTQASIVDAILGQTKDDKELLQTIQVFLECNSNATLAAKQLFMHRNSLQYRVDKFMEQTGIDVKQFQGALVTYLALLQLNLNQSD